MNLQTGGIAFENNLALAFCCTAGGLLLYQLGFYLLKRYLRKQEHFIPKLLQDELYFPGFLLFLSITAFISIHFLRSYIHWGVYDFVRHSLLIFVIIACSFLVVRALTVGRELLLRHYHRENPADFTWRKARTKFQLIQRVITFLVIIVTVAIVLMTFSGIRQLGSTLLASAGVIGLVLGFAAQKSLGTLFAGIQIAISQPIRLDDVVVVEGQFGVIGEISLTYVIVNTWDGRRLVVPINYFLEKSFENWTRVTPEIVGKVKFYADYTLPVEQLRAAFMTWVAESPLWDKRKAGLLITAVSEQTLELRATMSAANSDDSFDLECMIREKIIAWIIQNHPESLPQNRVTLSGKAAESAPLA